MTESFYNAALTFVKSITDEEMQFISKLDYGVDADVYLTSLRKVIFEQDGILDGTPAHNCIIKCTQFTYPYEVIELGSHVLEKGHEREFAICTLIIIMNVYKKTDGSTDLNYKYECQQSSYAMIPDDVQKLILDAYANTIRRET